MRQPASFKIFYNYLFLLFIAFRVVIRVECLEYRTIDFGGDGDGSSTGRLVANRRSDQIGNLGNVQHDNGFSPRAGVLDIRSRYWTRSDPEPEYPEEPEESASSPTSYATLSADDGEYSTSFDPSDSQHAYITVDRMDKEHTVTINMPGMSGKHHYFKKFVIQPVIQYVVQYDKNSQREGVPRQEVAASDRYEEYEGSQGQDRMRRGHGQRVDRFFNDVDAKFESYWGNNQENQGQGGGGGGGNEGYQNGGGGGYQSEGGGGGSSAEVGLQEGNGGDYQFGDGGGGGGYTATSQQHQPPNVNAFVSGGGYGGNNNGNSNSGGGGGSNGMSLSNAIQVSNGGQNQNQQQMYGPPGGFGGGQSGGGSNGQSESAGYSGMGGMSQSQGAPNGMQLANSGGHQMQMGQSPALGSLYGVPGMMPGNPVGSQQMMMQMPGSGSVGSVAGNMGAMGSISGMGQQAVMQGAMIGQQQAVMQNAMGQQPGMMQGTMAGQQQALMSNAMGQQSPMMQAGMGMGQQQQGSMPMTMGQSQGLTDSIMGMGGAGVASSGMTSSSASGGGAMGSSGMANPMAGLAQQMGGMVLNTLMSGGGVGGSNLMSALTGGVAQMPLQSAVSMATGGQGMPQGNMMMTGGGGGNFPSIQAISMGSGGTGIGFGSSSGAASNTGGVGGSLSPSYGPPTMSSDVGNPSPSYGPPTSGGSGGGSGSSSSAEEDDPRPPKESRGKKPGGGSGGGNRGKPSKGRGSGGRGGKSLLASLPKIPSSIGGHLSFMFSTGFGKGRRGSRGGGGGSSGGGSSKPSNGSSSSTSTEGKSSDKMIDKEQVSDHILNILGLTVDHPPTRHKSTAGPNNNNTNNPILLWEQQGNRASLNHLTSHLHGVTPEEVVAHLPVPEDIIRSTTSSPPLELEVLQSQQVKVKIIDNDNVTMTTTTVPPTTMVTTPPITEEVIFSTTAIPPIENVTNTANYSILATQTQAPSPTPSPTTSVSIVTNSQPPRIREPKNLQFPATFFTPPPPPLPPQFPFPTMTTVYDQDPLQEYMNHNDKPNIEAYYVEPGLGSSGHPLKIAQFDPMIYDALQAAFHPGQIDDNGVFFEALKRKKRRRNRLPLTLVDIRPSRSREFHNNRRLKRQPTPSGALIIDSTPENKE